MVAVVHSCKSNSELTQLLCHCNYCICKNFRMFIEKVKEQGNTELVVGNEEYGLVNIRKNIFQSNSLSHLLFAMIVSAILK